MRFRPYFKEFASFSTSFGLAEPAGAQPDGLCVLLSTRLSPKGNIVKTTRLTIYVIATVGVLDATICASELSAAIEADYGRLDALFRHFHANPELSV